MQRKVPIQRFLGHIDKTLDTVYTAELSFSQLNDNRPSNLGHGLGATPHRRAHAMGFDPGSLRTRRVRGRRRGWLPRRRRQLLPGRQSRPGRPGRRRRGRRLRRRSGRRRRARRRGQLSRLRQPRPGGPAPRRVLRRRRPRG